jgi:Predicted transcriptional regulator, consists of a Zn-ribbon and ATP-cone domains
MKCPKCDGKTKVLESRVSDRQHLICLKLLDLTTNIRRRRICLSCNYKFTSYEILHEDYDKLLKFVLKSPELVEEMEKFGATSSGEFLRED